MIDSYCASSSSLEDAQQFIRTIQERIKVHLSRDIIFTFSAHNNSLRLSLQAIGAQQLTHAPHTILLDRQEHLNRLLLFAAQHDDELVQALIDEGADVTTADSKQRTPLHIAAYHDNVRAVQVLLRAGASINMKDKDGVVPLYADGRLFGPGVARLLLESGATLEDNYNSMGDDGRSQETIKTFLEAGIKRFAPAQRETKIALQNIAFLIYTFGIKLRFPVYVIHDIILFATGELHDEDGNVIAPEWTQRLTRDLQNLYLYRCNSNQLGPLWAQTSRCIAKDPQEQLMLISKLDGYLEPFLANDTKRFVCLGIMSKAAASKKILGNKDNEQEILVDNFDLYFAHLYEYLHMSGIREE